MSLPLPSLNLDLKSTDLSVPRLATDTYTLEIGEVTVEPSKKNPSNHNLVVEFVTTEPASSTKGDEISPGYKLRKWFPLQQSDNPKAPDFKRDITLLILAAYAVDQANAPDFNEETVEGLKGRRLQAKVKAKDDEERGEQNEVSGFKALPQ